jgi:hypothetical protein
VLKWYLAFYFQLSGVCFKTIKLVVDDGMIKH